MADIGSYSSGNVNSSSAKFNNPTSAVSIGSYKSNSTTNTSRSFSSSSSTDISIDFNSFLDDVVINNYDVQEATGVKVVESAEPIAVENNVPWWKKAGDWLAETGATVVVTATSVISGVAELAESVVDGIAWCEGKVVNGASWLLGSAVGLVDEDAGLAIKDFGNDFELASREFIAEDWVGELNTWFYEETDVGKLINEKSAIKYDSELAMKIRDYTEKAGEIAAATALTIFTGGAGTFAVGALYGAGKSAENTYQQYGTDTTLFQEALIALNGGITGLSWMATGKLGKGALEIYNTAADIGIRTVVDGLMRDIISRDFWKRALKDGLTGANGVGNVISSLFMTGEDLLPYINGEKDLNAKAVGGLALIFLRNLGLNVAEDALRGYVTNFDANNLGRYNEVMAEAAAVKAAQSNNEVKGEEPNLEKTKNSVGELTDSSSKASDTVDDVASATPAVRTPLGDDTKIEYYSTIIENGQNSPVAMRALVESGDIDSVVMDLLPNSTSSKEVKEFFKVARKHCEPGEFSRLVNIYFSDDARLPSWLDLNDVDAVSKFREQLEQVMSVYGTNISNRTQDIFGDRQIYGVSFEEIVGLVSNKNDFNFAVDAADTLLSSYGMDLSMLKKEELDLLEETKNFFTHEPSRGFELRDLDNIVENQYNSLLDFARTHGLSEDEIPSRELLRSIMETEKGSRASNGLVLPQPFVDKLKEIYYTTHEAMKIGNVTLNEGEQIALKFVNDAALGRMEVGGFVLGLDALDKIESWATNPTNAGKGLDEFLRYVESDVITAGAGYLNSAEMVIFRGSNLSLEAVTGDEFNAWINEWAAGGFTKAGMAELMAKFPDPNQWISGKNYAITANNFEVVTLESLLQSALNGFK